MNHELFFKPSDRQPDRHDFEEYFEVRPHYAIDDTAVWYENESTGVYFSFELSDSASDKEDAEFVEGALEKTDANADDAGDDYWVAFNLQYGRPHVFALEALPEVRAFIAHFKLLVADPQDAGHRGPFSDTDFLNGWNTGNAFAIQSTLAEDGAPPLTFPTEALERNWRWNFSVVERQEKLLEDMFIPTIMYIKHAGAVKSVVVWPDAIPIYLPEVDMLVIARNSLAQPPISDDAPGETAIVEWAAFAPLLAGFPREQAPAPCYKLNYAAPPEALVTFIQALPLCTDDIAGLGKDEVIDAELVANLTKPLPVSTAETDAPEDDDD